MLPRIDLLPSPRWQDYELLDSGDGQKLERFGPYTFVRPEVQTFWTPGLPADQWNSAQMVQNLRAASIASETYRLDLQDYKNFKEQIYFQRISLLNYPKQLVEIKALELLKGLKVDHPDTGSKDVADTCVGAVKVLIQPLGLLGFDEGEYVGENLSASDDEGETVSMSLDTGEGVKARFHAGKTVGV